MVRALTESRGYLPVTALAVLTLAACAGQRKRLQQEVAPTQEQLLREGKRMYERACASCHGMDARGDGPVAPTLKTRPPDLTQLAARNGGTFPRDRVMAAVTGATTIPAHGTADMPVWRLRFTPTSSGAAAVAALRTRRWLDGMLDYLASIQEHS